MKTEIIKGFKGFDKDLKCRGKQYAENTDFEEKGGIKLCSHGIHYCENPLDVLNYYDLCESEFAEIEDLGTPIKETDKSVTNKIKIKIKLGLSGFIKASFEYLWESCKVDKSENTLAASGNYSQLAASGNYSQLAASGDSSQLAASGDSSKLAASGYSSKLAIEGKDSIAAAIGRYSQIKGIKGTWIVLAEYNDDNSVKIVKSAKIDGKKLKENTFYKLENGKFEEC
jgi:hypothetical protein